MAAVQVAGFHLLNVYIASVSAFGGFTAGAISTGRLTRGIEKNGEYRLSRNRLLLVLGLAIPTGAALMFVIVSGAIPLSIMMQFYSFYSAIPALYFGGVITFRRWELKNGKEIHWEGAWIGTFYAVPKGLTWQQQLDYRNEQRFRRAGNPADQAVTDKPHSD